MSGFKSYLQYYSNGFIVSPTFFLSVSGNLPDFTAGYADIVKCLFVLFISVQEVMNQLFYGHIR